MNATAASLDPDLAGGAIGYIAALGQCGSALFPWITGALAGSYGVWALQRGSYHTSKLISSRWRKRADYLLLRDVWVITLANRIAALLLAMILLEGGLWVVVVRMSREKWKSPHRF